MKFSSPLLRGRMLQRYKRFLVDIELDGGEAVTAHTPNPGSMLTCLEPGSPAWISPADNPKRKLAYTWELATSAGSLVGVNPILANTLAQRGKSLQKDDRVRDRRIVVAGPARRLRSL